MAQKNGWHREDIKAAVRKQGISFMDLAVSRGLQPNACALALSYGHVAGELAIAAFLGVPAQELWPYRFDPTSGERLKSIPRHLAMQATRNAGSRQRQKGQAA